MLNLYIIIDQSFIFFIFYFKNFSIYRHKQTGHFGDTEFQVKFKFMLLLRAWSAWNDRDRSRRLLTCSRGWQVARWWIATAEVALAPGLLRHHECKLVTEAKRNSHDRPTSCNYLVHIWRPCTSFIIRFFRYYTIINACSHEETKKHYKKFPFQG